MKHIYKIFITILIATTSFAQTYNESIDNLLDQVNLDSLKNYVRILSGEDSVIIKGEKVRIIDRYYKSETNILAGNYLLEKFEKFGLDAEGLQYSSYGRNIIGLQPGNGNSNKKYIICAHYDSVNKYCADDNASGTAAVLEVARVLSTQNVEFDIIYALWDEEEIGLIGSEHFADSLSNVGAEIAGVINLDMIGYDSNDDGIVEIHSKNSVIGADSLYESIMKMDSIYQLDLDVRLYENGSSSSDHASFLRNNYPAVLLIEGLGSGDFNPFYHSSQDRLSKFNLGYFYNVTKLAFASLANFVVPNNTTNVKPKILAKEYILNNNYPNPFNPSTNITYYIPTTSNVVLAVYDVLGRNVDVLVDGIQTPGNYRISFTSKGIPSGTYFYTLKAEGFIQTKKMVIVK